jgi:predicted nucleic acid-binding protein
VRLLDTDILIDLLRGVPQAGTWLASLPDAPGLPGFVVLELLQGCRNRQEARRVERLASVFTIYWPTVSRGYASRLASACLTCSSASVLSDSTRPSAPSTPVTFKR